VIDPLAVIEQGEDEEEMYEYGELSDGDVVSNIGPSQADILEEKMAQDNVLINEAVNEFIQDKRKWFYMLHKEHVDEIK
jgi:hypothetical protein